MRLERLLCACIVLASAIPLHAQIAGSSVFGNVTLADMNMSSYPADTSAAAVVLQKQRLVDISLTGELEPRRVETVYRRIKILKESGKDRADFQLLCYRSSNVVESIRVSTACTCNMEDGQIVRSYLSKEDIHEDDPYDNVHRYTFSLPNVRVGSVLEVVFVLESPRYWDVGRLDLQEDIPVMKAGVEVSYPSCFEFNRIKVGYLDFSHAMRSRTEFFQVRGGPSYDMLYVTDVISASNLPAVEADENCFCPSQYGLAVQYEMDKVNLPGVFERDFSTTWERVDDAFVKEGLLKACATKLKFAKEVEAAAAAAEDEDACIAALRALVLSKVRPNGNLRRLPALSAALKKGEGSSADLNALFASALSQCGYKAEPVMVKTRNRGIVLESLPSADMFDSFILAVTTPSGRKCFVDALSDAGYIDVLSPQLLSDHGRIVREKGKGEWVDLGASAKGLLNEYVKWTVGTDGSLTGAYSVNAYQEASFDMKDEFNEAEDEASFIDGLEKLTGGELSDFKAEQMEDWSPSCAFSCTVSHEPAGPSGDRIYVRPFVRPYHTLESFRATRRSVPVDFRYPEQIRFTANITIPEGYTVEELPQAVSLVENLSGCRAQMKVSFDGNQTVSLSYVYGSDAMQVLPDGYVHLRAFWGKMCELYDTVIVLKRQ